MEVNLDKFQFNSKNIKKLFDEREKHILEMSDVVSSQHKAVMQMSSKQPQSIMNSIISSNDNMRKAQEIINAEITKH